MASPKKITTAKDNLETDKNNETDILADILQDETGKTIENSEIQTEEKTIESVDALENSDNTQEEKTINKLYSVDELAMRFRVPSWQLAALLRLMDVEEDALIYEDDFFKGLERLMNRKMGTRG